MQLSQDSLRGSLGHSKVLAYVPPSSQQQRSSLSPRGAKLKGKALGQSSEVQQLYSTLAALSSEVLNQPPSRKIKKRIPLSLRIPEANGDMLKFSSMNKTIELYQSPVSVTNEIDCPDKDFSSEMADESSFTLSFGSMSDSAATDGSISREIKFVIREYFGHCYCVDLLVTETAQAWSVFIPTTASTRELTALGKRVPSIFDNVPLLLSDWILNSIVVKFKEELICEVVCHKKSIYRLCSSRLLSSKFVVVTRVQAVVRGFITRCKLKAQKSKQAAIEASRLLARNRIRQFKYLQHGRFGNSLDLDQSTPGVLQFSSVATASVTPGMALADPSSATVADSDWQDATADLQVEEQTPYVASIGREADTVASPVLLSKAGPTDTTGELEQFEVDGNDVEQSKHRHSESHHPHPPFVSAVHRYTVSKA